MERVYDQASDIWSLGCIFLELFSCHIDMNIKPSKRTPVFQGTSCYPLSPVLRDTDTDEIEQTDQFRVILDNLGRCSKEDMSFIENENGHDYVKQLNREALPKKDAPLHLLLNLKDSDFSAFVKPMLEVNPYFRPTAKELLKCKYFDDVRVPAYEHSSRLKLSLELDSDSLRDTDSFNEFKMTIEQAQEALIR